MVSKKLQRRGEDITKYNWIGWHKTMCLTHWTSPTGQGNSWREIRTIHRSRYFMVSLEKIRIKVGKSVQ